MTPQGFRELTGEDRPESPAALRLARLEFIREMIQDRPVLGTVSRTISGVPTPNETPAERAIRREGLAQDNAILDRLAAEDEEDRAWYYLGMWP